MARVKNNGGDATAPPRDWKVVAISLYMSDLRELDHQVELLKEFGHTKASRSALIRFALATVDLTKFPRQW